MAIVRKRIAIKVFYDGTHFHGFQRQPNGLSVENLLLEALSREGLIDDFKSARWSYASRTDKGVSALGQVVAFDVDKTTNITLSRVNRHILPSACLWGMAVVEEDFHPRYHALLRIYRYVVPLILYERMNFSALKEAASTLSNVDDYTWVVKPPKWRSGRVNLTIKIEAQEQLLVLEFKARSFYRYLIRRLVTLLLWVGEGRMDISKLKMMLRKGLTFKQGIPPAPPEGLILWDVIYPHVYFKVDLSAVSAMLKCLNSLTYRTLFYGSALYQVKSGLKGFLSPSSFSSSI